MLQQHQQLRWNEDIAESSEHSLTLRSLHFADAKPSQKSFFSSGMMSLGSANSYESTCMAQNPLLHGRAGCLARCCCCTCSNASVS